MRAAVLLLPIIAAAAVAVAGAPPGHDPYGNDGMDLNVAAALDAEMNATYADMNAAMSVGPAWARDGEWLYGGTDETFAAWYIDLRTSDLEARPIRVVARSDDSAAAGSRYGFTERELTIDCAKFRYRIVRTRHYDHAGNAAGPEEPGGGPLVRAAPGSIYAAVSQEACFNGSLTDDMIANSTVMNGM